MRQTTFWVYVNSNWKTCETDFIYAYLHKDNYVELFFKDCKCAVFFEQKDDGTWKETYQSFCPLHKMIPII